MDLFKSPASRLARLFRDSRDAWKARAMDKQQRLRAAQVRIRDLEKSRAYWRERALAAERQGTGAAASRGVEEREEPPAVARGVVVARHHYPLALMQLALQLYSGAGLGCRGVAWVLRLLRPGPSGGVPAYTTVLNWAYRCGLARLQCAPERRTDWIFVADHTLTLGAVKCLVILGIPASRLAEVGYTPTHRDRQVLAVEVTTHSTGPWVAAVLRALVARTGRPVQIVSDHGSDLRKGITLFQDQHAPACVETYDISHAIANLLKAELQGDTRWSAFLAHCRTTLSAFQQTDLAFLLPPRQRTKARYMHYAAHVEWAQRLLTYYDRDDFSAIGRPCVFSANAWAHLQAHWDAARLAPWRPLIGTGYPTKAALCEALRREAALPLEALDATFWQYADRGRARCLDAFDWLLADREHLHPVAQMMAQATAVQTLLKSQGLSADTPAVLQAARPAPASLTPRAAAFTTRLFAQVQEEAAKIPPGKTWLASSDIIESVFGKYKTFSKRGPLKEVGKLVLMIPVFLTDLTCSVIAEAMASVRTRDVERWVETHVGISLLARRRRAFKPDIKTA